MGANFIIIHNAMRRRREMEEQEEQDEKNCKVREQKVKEEAEMIAQGYKKEVFKLVDYKHFYRNIKKADTGFKILIVQSLIMMMGTLIPSIGWWGYSLAILFLIIATAKIFNENWRYSTQEKPDPQENEYWLYSENNSSYHERWVKK